MNPDEKREETPRSVADALQVVASADAQSQGVPQAAAAGREEARAEIEARVSDVQPAAKPPFFKQKRVFIPALAALVLLLGTGAYFLLGRNDGADSQDLSSHMLGIAVTVLDGKATASRDGETWHELTVRSRLNEGDFVRTDAGSRVVLSLDDGGAVRLDESTAIRLASLSAEAVRVEQRSGSVYSRVVASDRSFVVEVDDMSYRALGTAFQTTNTATEKGVRVLQSSVQFDDITVAEGKQYYTIHTDNLYVEKLTDISLDELRSNGFLLWNLEQDEKDSHFKNKLGYWEKIKSANVSTDPAPAGASLALEVANNSKGTVLSWTVTGVTAPDGFKIVRSQSSVVPTFGRDEAQHVSSPSARSFTWSGAKSGVFHYRLCVYRASDSTCSVYSNTVTIEAVIVAPEAVAPGAVNLSLSEDMINWTFAGTAPHGFKVLVSSSENPVYPKDAEYFGNGPYTLKPRAPGTYYVRVCKYTASDEISGGCTDYSNQVLWVVL